MKDQPYRYNLGADSEARDLVLQGLERFNIQHVGAMAYEDFQLYARNAQDAEVGDGLAVYRLPLVAR